MVGMTDLESDGWTFDARRHDWSPIRWRVTIVQPDGHVWGGEPLVCGAFTRRGACQHAANVVRMQQRHVRRTR